MAERRTVVVTGASRGIGHAIVRRFSEAGWRLFTCSRTDVPAECRRDPNWSAHLVADLSEPASRAQFFESVLQALDGAPLHALVNNAGISPKTPYRERLGVLHGEIEAWQRVFELNFYAPLVLARAFAPALAAGKGAVVNVTSIAGHAIHPFAGSAYSTSKAALSALTREMAAELAPLGVRANAVAPGEIVTEMISAEYEPLLARIPMQRMGAVDEVSGVIFQLCQQDFSYVTGSEVFITGGQHLV
jgi:NAD(P)-dependent dehydrogenase (short-subunit alcohol dehydrogenase family)